MKRLSKSKKLLIVLFILSALGVFLSILNFRWSIKQVEIDSFKEMTSVQTQHQLIKTKNLISEMVADLLNSADVVSAYEDIHAPIVRDILQFSNVMNWFDYTCVVDESGTGYDHNGGRLNVADQKYYQLAMEGNVTFSNPIFSELYSESPVQVCACPIRTDKQEVKGVLLGVIDLAKLQKIIAHKHNIYEQEANSNCYIYVVDAEGNYIGRLENHQLKISKSNFWDDMEAKTLINTDVSKLQEKFGACIGGDFSYYDGNIKRYACYMPIGIANWQLIYIVEDTNQNETIRSLYDIDTKKTIFAGICHLIMMLCIVFAYRNANKELTVAHNQVTQNIKLMRIALEHSQNIIFEYDQRNQIIELKSYGSNSLFNQPVIAAVPDSFLQTNIVCADSIGELLRLFEEIKKQDSSEADIQLNRAGQEIWYRIAMYNIYDEHTHLLNTVGIAKDISTRKREEIDLTERAERDGLTGLYNAATTRAKVSEILSTKHSAEEGQAFILLDVDHFKEINDNFGHSCGDQVLIDVANILSSRFRSSDIIGRLGGDEFAILLRNVKSYDYVEMLIEGLHRSLIKTYSEGDKAITISASIGVAMSPADGITFQELYNKSDIALYRVKQNGRNGYLRYQ